MSRPLRIEYPGAWYHVMNRGRRSESIFSDKQDYGLFLDLLIEATELWKVNIAAYCMMANHYHILLQTPESNISRCMRHLNSLYTQRYNKHHGYDGTLFRGRYKSVLVSNDSHLLQLARYIHKNPVKAGIVKHPEEYLWSSYKGYLSFAKKWDWLYKDYIFEMITPKKQGRLKDFIAFMQEDDSPEVIRLFSKKNLPSLFGPESFIAQIKEKYYLKKARYEVPESKHLAPEPDVIISIVCEYYNVVFEDLLISRRGVFNKPRNVAIYLLRQIRGDDLNSIKEVFHINTYSTVSSIVQKIACMTKADKKLRKEIQTLKEKVIKGQI
ncbi:MAG: transposase [Proteobacteria bacterium]|nr:transposase [Pseudomonadota bacterium]